MAESPERSGLGQEYAAEWREFRDPQTGRRLTQLTSSRGNCWPLYYFIPSITADQRYLVFHSERSGWVQLYRLDFQSGAITQLTDGRTQDSGWAIWCEWHLRGIYAHLTALNPVTNEVWYFQDDEIRAANIVTLDNRLIATLPPGRVPIGQNHFSPDGSQFAFIHADRARFHAALRRRESLTNMNQWTLADHDFMRSDMGIIALDTIDTRTGQRERVIETDFHFHHVLFLNNDTLLINHPKRGNGMWMVKRDGTGVRELRPASAPNAHNAAICHQVITANGIYYEANGRDGDEATMYLGRYDPATDTFAEIPLPGLGYCHTGFDPAGRFLFIESAGKSHQLLSVHHPHDAARRRLNLIRKLSDESRSGQRFHAHPFLTPDRNSMIFTDIAENGFGQIFRADVADLVNLREYW